MALAYSLKFRSSVEIAVQQIRDGTSIKHNEFWQEIEKETTKTA
jgi:hypothetical protein